MSLLKEIRNLRLVFETEGLLGVAH